MSVGLLATVNAACYTAPAMMVEKHADDIEEDGDETSEYRNVDSSNGASREGSYSQDADSKDPDSGDGDYLGSGTDDIERELRRELRVEEMRLQEAEEVLQRCRKGFDMGLQTAAGSDAMQQAVRDLHRAAMGAATSCRREGRPCRGSSEQCGSEGACTVCDCRIG